jgi:ubiquinone biosynthesis protein UbiJ
LDERGKEMNERGKSTINPVPRRQFDFATKVEEHLGKNDSLLRALLDVAEIGRQATETGNLEINGRFHVILDLVETYRNANSDFIGELYQTKAA